MLLLLVVGIITAVSIIATTRCLPAGRPSTSLQIFQISRLVSSSTCPNWLTYITWSSTGSDAIASSSDFCTNSVMPMANMRTPSCLTSSASGSVLLASTVASPSVMMMPMFRTPGRSPRAWVNTSVRAVCNAPATRDRSLFYTEPWPTWQCLSRSRTVGVRPQLTFLFIVSHTNVGRIKLRYVNLKNSYDVT